MIALVLLALNTAAGAVLLLTAYRVFAVATANLSRSQTTCLWLVTLTAGPTILLFLAVLLAVAWLLDHGRFVAWRASRKFSRRLEETRDPGV